MKCPGFEQLLDYCDGRLGERDAQTVAAHLASGCQRCAQDLEWYRRVRAIAASDDGVDPPAWVLKRALRLFENYAPPRQEGHLDRLIASLVFDSRAQPTLSGVRSAEAGNRQLLYRAGQYSVDVQITFSEQSGADLIGQVLRGGEFRFESVAGLVVEVAQKGQPAYSTVTNAVGEFILGNIACGEYEVAVWTNEGAIIIPQLPVMPSG
ncbi:MAG TPA: hypothetical protein VNO70_12060 [Blastocatellia bacterium]|nr:hypothetical protein [Blastocatellia bacterium]